MDDITTDDSTGFRPEYTTLAVAGVWLAILIIRLWRHGRASLAGMSLVILLAAAWVTMDGIGHARDGGWSAFWPEYSTVALAWLAFTGIAVALLRQGLRRPDPRRSLT